MIITVSNTQGVLNGNTFCVSGIDTEQKRSIRRTAQPTMRLSMPQTARRLLSFRMTRGATSQGNIQKHIPTVQRKK